MVGDEASHRNIYVGLSHSAQAFKADYVGDTHSRLLHAINDMLNNNHSQYGTFCPIIQGSGTGKSRMVDKLAETVFTIPVVLRPENDATGLALSLLKRPSAELPSS